LLQRFSERHETSERAHAGPLNLAMEPNDEGVEGD
jgi:hypothetical protein